MKRALITMLFIICGGCSLQHHNGVTPQKILSLKQGETILLAKELSQGQIQLPFEFYENRSRLTNILTDFEKLFTSQIAQHSFVLLVPLPRTADTHYLIEGQFKFQNQERYQIKSYAIDIQNERECLLRKNPTVMSEVTFKGFLKKYKYNIQDNSLADDFCTQKNIPFTKPCQLTKPQYFAALDAEGYMGFSHRAHVKKNGCSFLAAFFEFDRGPVQAKELLIYEMKGEATIQGDPYFPNLVDHKVFKNKLGFLESNLGIKLPTDSLLKFSTRFLVDRKNFLQFKLGYLSDSKNEIFGDRKIKSNSFTFKVEMKCGSKNYNLFKKTYIAGEISNPEHYFESLNIEIPAQCSRKISQLTFNIDRAQQVGNSLLFIANPVIYNKDFLQQQPNVIFISIDALRNDHTSFAGYERDTTPLLKKLLSKGTYFNQYFVQRSLTQTSLPIIFSGKQPYKLYQQYPQGRRGHWFATSVGENLPLYLEKKGYQVFGAVAAQVWGKFGPGTENFNSLLFNTAEDDNARYDAAYKWLAQTDPERSYFLWLHTLKVHVPYLPKAEFQIFNQSQQKRSHFTETERLKFLTTKQYKNKQSLEEVRALYDGYIRQADAEVVGFLLALEKAGKLENTLIVITSDHGENMWEHEQYFQHGTLQNASLHVPLILIYPGVVPQGKVISQKMESVDLYPTILQILGWNVPDEVQGQSYKNILLGKSQSLKKFTYADFNSKIFSIQNTQWKYIDNAENYSYEGVNFIKKYSHAKEELYDLNTDPSEMQNAIALHREEAFLLKEKLDHFYKNNFKFSRDQERLNPEVIKLLRKVGYLPLKEEE